MKRGYAAYCALLTVLLTSSARGDSAALTIDTPGTVFNFANASAGWEFTLSGSYTVTELGVYDYLNEGLDGDHPVGIYSCSTPSCTDGTLVVSGTVLTTDPLSDDFNWLSLASPVTLTPGNYVIAATTGPDDYIYEGGTYTFDPEVTWDEGLYSYSTTLVFPTSPDPWPDYGYFGPDFGGYDATAPEASSASLLAGGLAIVGLILSGRKFLLMPRAGIWRT